MDSSNKTPNAGMDMTRAAIWNNNQWLLTLTLDFPFQSKVSVLFKCRGKMAACPESLGQNASLLGDNFSIWWNSMALKTNATIQRKKLEGLEKFKIKELTIRLPKEVVDDTQKWSLELVTDPWCVFEASFQGFECVKSKHLEVY